MSEPQKKKEGPTKIALTEEEQLAKHEEKKRKAREAGRKWRSKNVEKMREYYKQESVHEKSLECGRKYRARIREEYNKRARERRKTFSPEKKREIAAKKVNYARERRHSNPGFRLLHNMRSAVNHRLQDVVKGANLASAKYTKYFGCTHEYLKTYLESQFREGIVKIHKNRRKFFLFVENCVI